MVKRILQSMKMALKPCGTLKLCDSGVALNLKTCFGILMLDLAKLHHTMVVEVKRCSADSMLYSQSCTQTSMIAFFRGLIQGAFLHTA